MKIVAIKKGQMTDQHKEAIRKSVSHPLTEEHKQKLRDSWTEERRKETGEKNLQYWADHHDEIVQKMREAVDNWKKHKDLPSEADNYREYQKLYHRMWYRENRERVLRQRNRRKRR